MRQTNVTQTIDVPDKVEVQVNQRKVTITGPRGKLFRDFGHMNVEIQYLVKAKKIKIGLWFGSRKQIAAVRTVCSHIENMFTGVLKGYEYKMRYVYAHFPINVVLDNGGKTVEIRNFLGERIVRVVDLLPGVTAKITEAVKDEIVLSGIDIDLVSQSAANIQQSTAVKNKDIRKFLDGIYVSEKGNIEKA